MPEKATASTLCAVPIYWTVHRVASSRFPYRVAVESEGRVVLAVHAPSPWPGPGQQIFCLREDPGEGEQQLDLIERVSVLSMKRIGRKLAIVLDRPLRKRCEFLSISKAYRDRPGTYEQIFFRTESGIRAHRSRTRLELQPREVVMDVVVDSGEKYAWRFPGARLTKRKLPAGDYALLDGERIAAVIERKSFDNFLGELGAMQALHHALADLARYDCAALVIEAQYADFLDPRRLSGRWPAAFTAKAIAELTALHPRLPVIFAGNRKLANQWAYRLFAACAVRRPAPQLELVREVGPSYGRADRATSLDEQLRETVLNEVNGRFAVSDLAVRFDGMSEARVRRVLREMEREGKVRCLGRGRGPRWELVRVNGTGTSVD
ncbi:MAG: ERCC4 domain-containing protein [Gemmatimonadaceae bacterium]